MDLKVLMLVVEGRGLGIGFGVPSLEATFLILIPYNSAPITAEHVTQASAWKSILLIAEVPASWV